MRHHRNLKHVPTDPAERQERVWWLYEHRAWKIEVHGHLFSHAWTCVDIRFNYVDPETLTIEDDETRNTHFEIWLEAGPMFDQASDTSSGFPPPEGGWENHPSRWIRSHDPDLDCGAADLETALLRLANLVELCYDPETGESRSDRPRRCEGTFDENDAYTPGCEPASDGYCARCGWWPHGTPPPGF